MTALRGLVLAGGRSQRMGHDKGSLVYQPDGRSQRQVVAQLLAPFVETVHLSIAADEADAGEANTDVEPSLQRLRDDRTLPACGPATALVTAHRHAPQSAWLVVACDFPLLSSDALRQLVTSDREGSDATAFVHPDGTLEPLLTLWHPAALALLDRSLSTDASPRRVLERLRTARLVPADPLWLVNANTPDERTTALRYLQRR